LSGGEVAAVDLTRAQLQALTRRDELERALATNRLQAEPCASWSVFEFARAIATSDLALAIPTDAEYQQFKADDVSRRPELTQLEQQLRAAQHDVEVARADRLPSLSYSINGGFDSDSLKGPRLKEHHRCFGGY